MIMAEEQFKMFDIKGLEDLKSALSKEADKAARIAVRMGILEHCWGSYASVSTSDTLKQLSKIEEWVMGDVEEKGDVSVKLTTGEEVVVRKAGEDALEGIPCSE